MYEDRAAVGVHVQFQILFKQFYVGPYSLVVLGGKKFRSAEPRRDMASQIIWLGWCFIVATTYFLSKRLCAYGEVQIAAWRIIQKILSSIHRESNDDDVWQNPVSLSSSLVSDIAFVPAWGTSILTETSRHSAGTYSSYCCTFDA